MKKLKRGKVPPKKTKHRFDAKRATNGSGKKLATKATAKKRPKGPRSQVLPGMEQVRVKELDNLAESLGEIRDQQATSRADEKENLSTALSIMHERGLNSYRFAKIEYLRSPGEEKIRARVVKERGAMAGDAELDDEQAEDNLEAGDTDDGPDL